MADTSVPVKKAVAKKPKVAPSHPPVAQMVNEAIEVLKERRGSSLAAIKKCIATTHKVDVARLAPFIRRYLKSAVEAGKLEQTKGTGASGSFRLGKPEPKPKKEKTAKATTPKKPRVKTIKKPKTVKKTPAKKPVQKTPKKAAAKPKKPATKSPKPKKTAAKKLVQPATKKPAAKPKAKKTTTKK